MPVHSLRGPIDKANLLYVRAVPVHGVAVVPVNLAQVQPHKREEVQANRRDGHYYIPPLPRTRRPLSIVTLSDSQSTSPAQNGRFYNIPATLKADGGVAERCRSVAVC